MLKYLHTAAACRLWVYFINFSKCIVHSGGIDMATFMKQFQSIGFGLDQQTVTGYRKVDGFCFTVRIDVNRKMYTVSVPCAVHREEDARNMNAAFQQFAAERKKTVKSAFYDGRQISICYQSKELTINIIDGTKEAVDACMYYIRQYSAVPICPVCGRAIDTNIYAVENAVNAMCGDCFLNAQRKVSDSSSSEQRRVENVPLGIVGAILGGLAGAVLWVLFSLMGRIVIIAGALSALAGYLLYKKLAGKISKKGLILSLVIAFIFLLIGMYFAIGLDVMNGVREYGVHLSLAEAFRWIPEYVSENTGVVIFNNIFGIVSFLAGAGISAAHYQNENKMKNRTIQLA